MPLVDRRANLTPANNRNADVAHRLIEDIAPMQQARQQAAYRVNGIEAILYSKLNQGRRCVCHSKNAEVTRLNPDGKASAGAIDRIITGNSNFGIGVYQPTSKDITQRDGPTSPNNGVNQWRGDNNTVGDLDEEFNQLEDSPILGDAGQFSPDMDDMFDGFDIGSLGLSDISCPICFGTSYVGGYSPFRAWRHVILATELDSPKSFYDTSDFSLSPGNHEITVTLPRGAQSLDVCRTMHGKLVTASTLFLDGRDITRSRFVDLCDGRAHRLRVVTNAPLTHIEIQTALSTESIYFELPKITRSADQSFLDQTEPFNILVSPDIPRLETMDVIAESQSGKILVVQSANPWNTRLKNMLGFECQVRVAQPQELWNILPRRRKITGQKRVMGASPNKSTQSSGLANVKGFTF